MVLKWTGKELLIPLLSQQKSNSEAPHRVSCLKRKRNKKNWGDQLKYLLLPIELSIGGIASVICSIMSLALLALTRSSKILSRKEHGTGRALKGLFLLNKKKQVIIFKDRRD